MLLSCWGSSDRARAIRGLEFCPSLGDHGLMSDATSKLFGVTLDLPSGRVRSGSIWRLLGRSHPGTRLQEADVIERVAEACGHDLRGMRLEPGRDASRDLLALCQRGDNLVFIYTDSPPAVENEEGLRLLSADPTCTPEGLLDFLTVAGAVLPVDVTSGAFGLSGNPPASLPVASAHQGRGVSISDFSVLDEQPFDPNFVSASVPGMYGPAVNHGGDQPWLNLHHEVERIFNEYVQPDPEDPFSGPVGLTRGLLRFVDATEAAREPVIEKFLLIPWDAVWSTYRVIHLAASALVRLAAPLSPSLAREPLTPSAFQSLLGGTPANCDAWTETGKPLLDRQVKMLLEQQDAELSGSDETSYSRFVDQLPTYADARCPGVIQSLFMARGFAPFNSIRTLALFTTHTMNATMSDDVGMRFAYPGNRSATESAASIIGHQLVGLYAELDSFPLRVCRSEKCARPFIRQSGPRSRKATPSSPSRRVDPETRHSRGVVYCSPRCGARDRQARYRGR